MSGPGSRRRVLLAVGVVMVALLALRVAWPSFSGQVDIAHAGGAIEGERYTDSVAALERSAAAGFRTIEIDVRKTADGEFVCGHDWRAFGGDPPDLASFLARRGELRFPPCTLQELVAWFARHPDIMLYADIKEDELEAAALIASALGKDRFIAEATSPPQACRLRQAGIPHVVLSTYLRPDSYLTLVRDLSDPCVRDVEAVAIPMGRVFRGHAVVARLVSGLPVLAHTPRNCWTTRLARLMGADAFFTDLEAPGRC